MCVKEASIHAKYQLMCKKLEKVSMKAHFLPVKQMHKLTKIGFHARIWFSRGKILTPHSTGCMRIGTLTL